MTAREFLDLQAQRVYTTLEMMSQVKAANLGQHVHQGKPGSTELALDERPPHDTFRRRYDNCRTDSQRQTAVEEAHVQIKDARYSRHPTVDCQTLEGRLIVGRDTRPAEVVAHAYGYSVRHIHNLRAQARQHDARILRRAA